MSTTTTPLRAVFLNCTLKPSPEPSHTQALMERAQAIMEAGGVEVDTIRAADHDIATGVLPDMTVQGAARDDWPALRRRVLDADILVLGTPIWLGDKSSVCTRVVERLYASSSEVGEHGQPLYYGRVGGVVVTGNEDGVKHVAMNVVYSLQHLGFAIPPQSDCGWIGEAGPGPSYADPGSGGPENEFTRTTTATMARNVVQLAALLKRAGGFPAQGDGHA